MNLARTLTMVTMALGGWTAICHSQESLLTSEDRAYLESLTAAVLEASRVAPGDRVGPYGPNTTGGTLIRPGGRDCYPAFWIRDYAMSLESGFISPEEQRHALLLTAATQQDEDRELPSGSLVPAGAIADHITFDGKPIFYPGVLDDAEGQGGERWGKIPSLDDHFFFVLMAGHYIRATGDTDILSTDVRGKSLLDRVEAAFAMPPSRPDTHLVHCTPDRRGVNFGFYDTVIHTGDLLYASVLKWQAAGVLADLLERSGRPERARYYHDVAKAIRGALVPVFGLDSGLFRASTGTGAQPDVWGTAYAACVGALPDHAREAACRALARAYSEGTIAWRGMIRHVPTDADFSPQSAWEEAYTARNTYQNGAYWPVPTGWVCRAIAQVDRALAQRLAGEYVAALREDDFRNGPDFGAPWECMHPDDDHRQNPVYLCSVTCPLAALRD